MDTINDYLEEEKVYSVFHAQEVNSVPLGNVLICEDGYPHLFSIEELERVRRLIDTTLAAYDFAGWGEGRINRINLDSYAALSPSWLPKPYVRNTHPISSNETFIYIIGNYEKDLCKVGQSDRPYLRIKNLQTASPYKLEIIEVYKGDFADEKELHKLLNKEGLSLHGEWFSEVETVLEIADFYFGYGKGV